MKAGRIAWSIGLLSLSATARLAAAQFVPGHIFVSRPSGEFCMVAGYPDRIWEINPDTGEVTLFAEFGPASSFDRADCGYLNGLAFTPDGCSLLVSSLLTSEIRAFDSTGNWTVALDRDDGISAPWGSNNLAFDGDGNLYVVNAGSRTIMRFPPEGGPGVVFADQVAWRTRRGLDRHRRERRPLLREHRRTKPQLHSSHHIRRRGFCFRRLRKLGLSAQPRR